RQWFSPRLPPRERGTRQAAPARPRAGDLLHVDEIAGAGELLLLDEIAAIGGSSEVALGDRHQSHGRCLIELTGPRLGEKRLSPYAARPGMSRPDWLFSAASARCFHGAPAGRNGGRRNAGQLRNRGAGGPPPAPRRGRGARAIASRARAASRPRTPGSPRPRGPRGARL